MPDPGNIRPKCIACTMTFDDEDVENNNYFIIQFDPEKGPTFAHRTCMRAQEGWR